MERQLFSLERSGRCCHRSTRSGMIKFLFCRDHFRLPLIGSATPTLERAEPYVFGREDSLSERWIRLHGDRQKCRESMSEYSITCIDIRLDKTLISADEHAQTSVSEHGDCHSPARRGSRRRRRSTPGCSSWARNHPPPESVFPRAARKASASVRRACIPGTYTTAGPDREPGRILIPGNGAAGDQGAQNRPACPGMAATRRLRAVPSQRPPGAMVSGAHAVL